MVRCLNEELRPSFAGGRVTEIFSEEDLQEVTKQNEGTVIGIYFYRAWCTPCKKLTPVYESLADQYNTIVLLKMDGLGDLGSRFGADGYPTFVFLKNGKFLFSFDRGNENTLRQVANEPITLFT
ncbi:thioredoxin [Opisthorchis viverrini]|uniref:Thioredoxin n=1 Tax=Opisthorchis viverrini TaxID=6198 RepID=A0A1S8X839_OPIVI|nr:thioredoxin [Opisthorchis viverrini]